MTLANKITVLRIIAIPLFVIALLEGFLPWARWIFILSIFPVYADEASYERKDAKVAQLVLPLDKMVFSSDANLLFVGRGEQASLWPKLQMWDTRNGCKVQGLLPKSN